jgi:hypothetical protein
MEPECPLLFLHQSAISWFNHSTASNNKEEIRNWYMRFQVLTAASMKFRTVFWDDSSLMMEAARTSETSVNNYFTRQYIPEDKSELHKKLIPF